MKILPTLLNYRKRQQQSGLGLISLVIALILFLIFVMGLICIAQKIIDKLNRLFPCNPNSITQFVIPTHFVTEYFYANWNGTIPNTTPKGIPHKIGFSSDGLTWATIAEVVCWPEEVENVLQSFIDDDEAYYTNEMTGFYYASTNVVLPTVSDSTDIYVGPGTNWVNVNRLVNEPSTVFDRPQDVNNNTPICDQ